MTDQAIPLTRPVPHHRSQTFRGIFRVQCNVFVALCLHDMKNRFFGNVWGYFATVIWPGIHLSFLIVAHTLHLVNDYGDSVVLFAATGVMPFIAWHYIARFTMHGEHANRPLLNYPIVGPLDLVFSRLFLEITTVFMIFVLLICFLLMIDVNPVPNDLTQASLGMLSAVLLGIGFAILCGVISPWFPFMNMLWMFFTILAHLFSGIAFPVENMPHQVQEIIAWNPLLHTVEWIRVSYWNDYPSHLLSKTYCIYVGLGAGVLGLVLERVLRRVRKVKH